MAKNRGTEVREALAFKAETMRGRAGFFRAGQTAGGRWWLLDPAGAPFFMKSVAAVNRHGRAGPPPEHPGACARAVDAAGFGGEPAGFAREALRRLRSWQFNTIGPWADPMLATAGLYSTMPADFRSAGAPVIRRHGVLLPDVFDSSWEGACDLRAAEIASAWAGRTDLAGHYTDDALGWGEARPDRPSLLQCCLSLEPSFAAYHAAWEFVLAPHGGDLAALAKAWRTELSNKETLRQRTQAELPVMTEGYLRDHERFTREFARRYFTTTSAALHRHDPDHLVLGCRFSHPPGAAVLAECVYPHVDAVSWHCHGPDVAAQAEDYAQGASMPLLPTGFGPGGRFRTGTARQASGHTRLERMLKDGRRALTEACAHPAVIGYEWARWADEEEDVPPFGAGLVHTDDREAVEHTELLAQFNARAEALHLRAARG